MQALVANLAGEVGRAAAGGSKAANDKHRKAGKLSARERIGVLDQERLSSVDVVDVDRLAHDGTDDGVQSRTVSASGEHTHPHAGNPTPTRQRAAGPRRCRVL